MIKIVAKMILREECITQFCEEAKELVEKSRGEEGNVSYSLNRSTSDPRVFCFMEIWKDAQAIDAQAIESHNATAHFTTILPKLAAMTAEDQPVDLYEEVEF